MRKMSVSVENQIEEPLASDFQVAEDAQSELGDGSSSLSDIEDKEGEQDDLDDQDDILSENEDESDANDSEAETERLENSPHTQRKSKDVVLSSQAESRTYERSPSKLQHQFQDEEEDEDDEEDENDMDNLSDDEGSIAESTKSTGMEEVEQDPTTATTSLEDSSGEGKGSMAALDIASKKRKRSLLPEGGLTDANDLDEPARKRTGSVVAGADDYIIDDTASPNGDAETSNPISGDISDAESNDEDDDNHEDAQDEVGAEDDLEEQVILVEDSRLKSERKKNWKKKSGSDHLDNEQDGANGALISNEASHEAGDGDEHEETMDIDGDEAEMALKNEEEQERKRVAMEQLGDIERHFTSFRDRLYDERLAQLEQEEAMLRQDKPTHPEYLVMLQCIDARRDEKIRIQERLLELKLETLKRSSVGKRSQILSQYYQEVRDVRERKLEMLGKMWYEIQHDRRGHGANMEDYVLKYPTRKSQQLSNQIAYNTEVSITSGIAKYIGFPSAPKMASATAAQMEEDTEKINAIKLKNLRIHPDMPIQNMAAIRAAAVSTFKPAEEQFIEQTPWANPQHPSNAHLIQRQASAHQAARTSSPFSNSSGAPRRHSHATTGPVPGTFSTTAPAVQPHTNGASVPGGRTSPLNPFTNHSQKVAHSPLDSRQTSLPPQRSRAAHVTQSQQDLSHDFSIGSSSTPFLAARTSTALDISSGFAQDSGVGSSVKMEQVSASTGRY